MQVSAIVPAYNEVQRVGKVVDVVTEVKLINEIIVVSDGSTDGTFELMDEYNGVKAIKIENNIGKAGAIKVGVENTDSEVLLFLDADLVGLETYHLVDLLQPVLSEEAEMTIGVFQDGKYMVDLSFRFFPQFSGQRALRREIFLGIPQIEKVGFALELILTRYAHWRNIKIKEVILPGVTHIQKEEKMGIMRAVPARVKMYWEMGKYLVRTNGSWRV